MKQYGLSPQRITRVIRSPKRKEEGIAKNTVAVMQPVSSKKSKGKELWNQEIWAMYQKKLDIQRKNKVSESMKNNQIKIISAWRYPGVSPKRNPVPQEILEEISNIC